MAQLNSKELTTLPVGRLGLVPLQSCRPLGEKVDEWLVQWRKERISPELDSFAFEGYRRDSYIVDVKTPRFGSGEGKGEIGESVRGDDIYLMVDVCNHSLSYRISGFTNLMSPDDHFQDLKRAIAAIGGKARRIELSSCRISMKAARANVSAANPSTVLPHFRSSPAWGWRISLHLMHMMPVYRTQLLFTDSRRSSRHISLSKPFSKMLKDFILTMTIS